MNTEIQRLVWKDEELSVGVKVIDEQHKKLVRIINTLQDAVESGKVTEVFGATLESLEDYARTHFRMEEEFMILFKFPDFASQKTSHGDFETKIQKFKMNPEETKDGLIKYLNVWLYHHILWQDKKLGEFLNTLGVR